MAYLAIVGSDLPLTQKIIFGLTPRKGDVFFDEDLGQIRVLLEVRDSSTSRKDDRKVVMQNVVVQTLKT
jgi:hypothetical protein